MFRCENVLALQVLPSRDAGENPSFEYKVPPLTVQGPLQLANESQFLWRTVLFSLPGESGVPEQNLKLGSQPVEVR